MDTKVTNADILAAVLRLTVDVGTLQQDVGGLKQDVSDLKKDVGTLQESVGSLQREVEDSTQNLKSFIELCDGRFNTLEEHLPRQLRHRAA